MESKRRKLSEKSSAGGAPTWMLTYADTVTLLMCFFVMLMSFSTLDDESYEKIRGGLAGYLGLQGGSRLDRDSFLMRRIMASSRVHVEGYENPPEHDPVSHVVQDFDIRVRSTSFANLLNYRLTRHGFEIHILAGAIFEEGSARFKTQAAPILDMISHACRHLPHHIRVQGYPDIYLLATGEIAASEKLSIERAAVVCEYLSSRDAVAVERISAATQIQTPNMLLDSTSKRQITIAVVKPPKRSEAL